MRRNDAKPKDEYGDNDFFDNFLDDDDDHGGSMLYVLVFFFFSISVAFFALMFFVRSSQTHVVVVYCLGFKYLRTSARAHAVFVAGTV